MQDRDLNELIEKFNNTKIIGLSTVEQMKVFNYLKELKMYQSVGSVAKFMGLAENSKISV